MANQVTMNTLLARIKQGPMRRFMGDKEYVEVKCRRYSIKDNAITVMHELENGQRLTITYMVE